MPIPGPAPTPPGLYVTSQDIIQGALRLINVQASGESLDPAEGYDALVVFNQMIDSWQADKLKIFAESRQVFTLTTGQQEYTIGIDPSGATVADFSVPRPAKIDRMTIIQVQATPYPVELPMSYLTYQQWADIPTKQVPGSLAFEVWDDQGFPFRTWMFWPIPNTGCQTAMYSWVQLQQITDLGSTRYAFPPGYLLAMRYSLAELLAPEYGAQAIAALPVVKDMALQLRSVIEAMNAPVIDLRVDAALISPDGGYYNYFSDQAAGGR